MAETSLIKKRRRLSALYDKGVEVRIGGRYGEGVIARGDQNVDLVLGEGRRCKRRGERQGESKVTHG